MTMKFITFAIFMIMVGSNRCFAESDIDEGAEAASYYDLYESYNFTYPDYVNTSQPTDEYDGELSEIEPATLNEDYQAKLVRLQEDLVSVNESISMLQDAIEISIEAITNGLNTVVLPDGFQTSGDSTLTLEEMYDVITDIVEDTSDEVEDAQSEVEIMKSNLADAQSPESIKLEYNRDDFLIALHNLDSTLSDQFMMLQAISQTLDVLRSDNDLFNFEIDSENQIFEEYTTEEESKESYLMPETDDDEDESDYSEEEYPIEDEVGLNEMFELPNLVDDDDDDITNEDMSEMHVSNGDIRLDSSFKENITIGEEFSIPDYLDANGDGDEYDERDGDVYTDSYRGDQAEGEDPFTQYNEELDEYYGENVEIDSEENYEYPDLSNYENNEIDPKSVDAEDDVSWMTQLKLMSSDDEEYDESVGDVQFSSFEEVEISDDESDNMSEDQSKKEVDMEDKSGYDDGALYNTRLFAHKLETYDGSNYAEDQSSDWLNGLPSTSSQSDSYDLNGYKNEADDNDLYVDNNIEPDMYSDSNNDVLNDDGYGDYNPGLIVGICGTVVIVVIMIVGIIHIRNRRRCKSANPFVQRVPYNKIESATTGMKKQKFMKKGSDVYTIQV